MTMRRRPRLSRQRGVAVITALLLTTLAITIVASLFWQQQVQVRSIENQRLQLQKQWILRGALDWTKLILREDFRGTPVDHLGEPWAVGLEETRLDQYVENASADGDTSDAALSGHIIDAQSRFNLKNLLEPNGTIDKKGVTAFGRLLTALQLNPALAQGVADLMLAAQPGLAMTVAGGTPGTLADGTPPQPPQQQQSQQQSQQQPMTIAHVDDLLAVPGFTPEMVEKLRDFVVVLPRRTLVNINTAPAEVLYATIDTLSLSEAQGVVVGRENSYFQQVKFLEQRLQGKQLDTSQLSVVTSYFLVNGDVRLNRASLQMQALIERSTSMPSARVVWVREN